MAVQCLTPPGWPRRVRIATTTRVGGVSRDPWRGYNLADHVGDDPAAVQANRRLLASAMPEDVTVHWLAQEHGTRVVAATTDSATPPVADGCWTRQPGIACAVLTADCLPILLCSGDGGAVAAVHAGWRGLVAGVVEAAVRAMDFDPVGAHAWLGPAIGSTAFEVGGDVRDVFFDAARVAGRNVQLDADCFRPGPRPGHFLADITGLARLRLAALGLTRVQVDGRCTVSAPDTFFSFRRDGQTGRMASLVFIDDA